MDIQLYYEEHGQGFPLILLHGNGEDHTYFSAQITFFSTRFRVIAIDTRGHGQSPRGSRPFTISQFADDLYDFFQQKQLQKAHILGFSDGGNVALTFALRHPDCVERLILNGANLYPSGVKWTVQAPIVLGYGLASLFSNEKARRHAELLALMVKEPHLSPSALQTLSMPALVIAGTQDMIRSSHTRLIARSIPNSRLTILSGNHFIAHEHPDAFNRAVEIFLNPEA